VGHSALVPEHVSAMSQRPSRAGRQTVVLEAKLQDEVQQALEVGSQTAPDVKRH